MARVSEEALKQEFYKLDLLACNGRLLTHGGIRRWVKLYRRLYKSKQPVNQLIAKKYHL